MFVFLFLKEIHRSTGAAVTKDSGTGEMLLLDTKKHGEKKSIDELPVHLTGNHKQGHPKAHQVTPSGSQEIP